MTPETARDEFAIFHFQGRLVLDVHVAAARLFMYGSMER